MTIKHFAQLLSPLILLALLAGQYGLLAIPAGWYTFYAVLTCIGIIASLIVIFITPSIDVQTMTSEEKEQMLARQTSPVLYFNVPASFVILINAGFEITAILSAVSSVVLLLVLAQFKSRIFYSM